MRSFGLIALGISIVVACGQSTLPAKEPNQPRRIQYSFPKGDAFVIVTIQETAAGARGDVVFSRGSISSARSYRGSFEISHPEFERMCSTLNAPGVLKRAVAESSIPSADYHLFRVGSKMYYFPKASSPPAVTGLSIRVRALADNVMATVKEIPRTDVTALEVIDYGIYDRGPIEQVKSPADSRLIKKTEVVPIRAGYHYGVRWRLKGSPDGAPVEIAQEFKIPKSHDPKTGKWTTRRRERYTVLIGEVYFSGLYFRDRTEYASGEHKVRVFLGSKQLLEQVFHVVAAK